MSRRLAIAPTLNIIHVLSRMSKSTQNPICDVRYRRTPTHLLSPNTDTAGHRQLSSSTTGRIWSVWRGLVFDQGEGQAIWLRDPVPRTRQNCHRILWSCLVRRLWGYSLNFWKYKLDALAFKNWIQVEHCSVRHNQFIFCAKWWILLISKYLMRLQCNVLAAFAGPRTYYLKTV